MDIEKKLKLAEAIRELPDVLKCSLLLTMIEWAERLKGKENKKEMDKSLEAELKVIMKILKVED